jgi:hypothetical protein
MKNYFLLIFFSKNQTAVLLAAVQLASQPTGGPRHDARRCHWHHGDHGDWPSGDSPLPLSAAALRALSAASQWAGDWHGPWLTVARCSQCHSGKLLNLIR